MCSQIARSCEAYALNDSHKLPVVLSSLSISNITWCETENKRSLTYGRLEDRNQADSQKAVPGEARNNGM